MEDMALEVNPLELSLDEMIALNKAKNKPTEEQEEHLSLSLIEEVHEELLSLSNYTSCNSHNGYNQKIQFKPNPAISNGHLPPEAYRINNRLRRNIPGFGSRPIHNRLGYFRKNTYRRNYRTPQAVATRLGLRARYNMWVKSQKENNNCKYPAIKYRVTNSTTTSGSAPSFRHSVRTCLNPFIQKELQELAGADLTRNIDESLESFQPSNHKTALLMDQRFSLYF